MEEQLFVPESWTRDMTIEEESQDRRYPLIPETYETGKIEGDEDFQEVLDRFTVISKTANTAIIQTALAMSESIGPNTVSYSTNISIDVEIHRGCPVPIQAVTIWVLRAAICDVALGMTTDSVFRFAGAKVTNFTSPCEGVSVTVGMNARESSPLVVLRDLMTQVSNNMREIAARGMDPELVTSKQAEKVYVAWITEEEE